MEYTANRRRVIAIVSRMIAAISASAILGRAGMGIAMAAPSTRIGAIRWDPWYEPNGGSEKAAVVNALDQTEFRGRAPSFSRMLDGHLSVDGGNQAQMDAEITLASQCGVAFWAYCFYGETSAMMTAWRLHRSSAIASKVGWCFLFPDLAKFGAAVARSDCAYGALMAEVGYQRVVDGRPLVFILDDGSSFEKMPAAVATFRGLAVKAGLPQPYIAVMSWDPNRTKEEVLSVRADAVSAYSVQSPRGEKSFRDLETDVRGMWAEMLKTGLDIVPLAVTGKDRRPRVMRPVPWEKQQTAMAGSGDYYRTGSPAEIAGEIAQLSAFVSQNPVSCRAKCGIVYSWDECDEGGSTLLPSVGQGDSIIRAVAKHLVR